ncbi:hypothetical protein PU630_09390 [Microbacterium horticulturae]|uniref:ABC-2 type transport system permease protein n=1 Tax=Microbacterium horticulturae TaxID=3028316 RepID=A0ABY8BWI4_9MICO|nr:hypothetical protein [Microbacterium sp. KACC 23027]WEG07477.1 hypothetical protein PU630_09390 [Microbacterium sp. KACC 23027]
MAPLRRGAGAAVGRTLALLVLAVAVVIGCWGLLQLQTAGAATAGVVTVLSGSAITLGFVVAPLLTGTTDPLDPRAFRGFGLRSGRLAATLAASGMLTVPVLAETALAVCLAVLWIRRGVAWPAAVGAAVLGTVTCLLAARVFRALATMFLAPRRSRELTGVLVVGVLVLVVPVAVFLVSLRWNGHVPHALVEAVHILARTPFGAAWALPWRTGALSLVVALVTVALLAAAWWGLVHRALRTVEPPAVARGIGGLGWFAVTPSTPGGAVAARSLLYWLTDLRYLANLAVLPIIAAVAMVPLLIIGLPFTWVVLVPAPILALFFGWLPHNDLAYDSTAIWVHLASGVRGISDRVGRIVPVAVIGVVVLAVVIPVSVGLHGDWAIAPVMVGVCATLFLGGLGLSSIASAAAPSPVTRPGDSPFRQPERTGSGGVLAQGIVLLASLLVSAPVLWWGWLSLDERRYVDVAMWGGIAIGVVTLALGLGIGAAVFERRGTRLLELAEAA